jgi:hypothetical protein
MGKVTKKTKKTKKTIDKKCGAFIEKLILGARDTTGCYSPRKV